VGVLQVDEPHTTEFVAGSAVRQDGKSVSLTAPNGRAQRLLLDAVLANASTTPAQLQLVEAAANGSAMGDPIETGAISAVLLALRRESDALLAGSIKANVGHTESASGMLGLTKLLSAMRCSHAPPNAQLKVVSGHIAAAWENAPSNCALPAQLAAVRTDTSPGYGTGSSFGLGGTIASAVLRVMRRVRDRAHNLAFISRRRSFLWRKPMRVHIAWRGAFSGLVLCEQPAFTAGIATGEVEMQVAQWASISKMSSTFLESTHQDSLHPQAMIVLAL
jgi:hypothetical protein